MWPSAPPRSARPGSARLSGARARAAAWCGSSASPSDVARRHDQALADLFCHYPNDVVTLIPYDFSIGYKDRQRQPRVKAVEALTRQREWVEEWAPRLSTTRSRAGASSTTTSNICPTP